MRTRRAVPLIAGFMAAAFVAAPHGGVQWAGSPDRDHPAIAYASTPPEDPVARLRSALAAGTAHLEREGRHGYLRSVLRALDIPVSSQVLVFSKTSLQKARISPTSPRAIYFNDQSYVAFVPGGAVLELAAVDPRQGIQFYTLDQTGGVPRLQRQTTACLECHDTRGATGGVPGLLLKSHYTTASGEVLAPAGVYGSMGAGPFASRWGGWFVTGTAGGQMHMGNAFAVRGRRGPELAGRTPRDLGVLPAEVGDRYLSHHSDLAALLVLEHQARTQNLLTRLGYRARMALDFDRTRRARAGDASVEPVESATQRYLAREAEPVAHALLRTDEPALRAPVAGSSAFAIEYVKGGTRDQAGRSCRDLDLTSRVARYACSPLLQAPAFSALPRPALASLLDRMLASLGAADNRMEYRVFPPATLSETRELLRQTLPAFAAAVSRP